MMKKFLRDTTIALTFPFFVIGYIAGHIYIWWYTGWLLATGIEK